MGSFFSAAELTADKWPSSMQIAGLPTMVFVAVDKTKPALRTEGLLPAQTIKEIVMNELQ